MAGVGPTIRERAVPPDGDERPLIARGVQRQLEHPERRVSARLAGRDTVYLQVSPKIPKSSGPNEWFSSTISTTGRGSPTTADEGIGPSAATTRTNAIVEATRPNPASYRNESSWRPYACRPRGQCVFSRLAEAAPGSSA